MNKKGELTNKTLAILLMAAIIVSLGGTLISLSRLSKLGVPSTMVTGAATDTGYANLTISSTTSITFINSTLSFGSGYVNSSFTNCTLDSDGTSLLDGPCVNFKNVTDGLLLENSGNTDVYLNISFDQDADYIGGSGVTPLAQYKTTAASTTNHPDQTQVDTADSCKDGWNTATYTNISSAGATIICGNATDYNFTYPGTQDGVEIDVKFVIPENATAGDKNLVVTAVGTATG